MRCGDDGFGSPRPYPDWLRDTERTRRAVVAALDDPQCRVPPGETRPGLHGACGAEAMVRLAKMQHACLYVLEKDWSNWPETGLVIVERGDLEEYHRLVEVADRSFAGRMWGYSRGTPCAPVSPGVLDWIDTLPTPSEEESASAISVPTQAPELSMRPRSEKGTWPLRRPFGTGCAGTWGSTRSTTARRVRRPA
ncbi:MAG: hypothetical protein OXH09_11160 [Gammaproteobacteria bacterium]|nr:hypothetical protein [Gammaproteobacteria bacterium]